MDTVEIIKERIENLNADVRRILKQNNLNYSNFKVSNDSLKFVVEGFNNEIQKEISNISVSNSQNILQMGDQTNLIISQDQNTVEISFTDEFIKQSVSNAVAQSLDCLLYTSPSPRDTAISRMPSSA